MIYKSLKYVFLTLLVLSIAGNVASASALPREDHIKKMAVLPFAVHSESEDVLLRSRIEEKFEYELARSEYIRIIKKDVFYSLLKGKKTGGKSMASIIGNKTDADFVITGSITKLGKLVSVDIGILDVKRNKDLGKVFAQGSDTEDPGALAVRLTRGVMLECLVDQKISEISFKGNLRIEDSAILNVIKSEKEKLFSKQQLSSDIKAIYGMGYFKDVRAEVTDGDDGKIVIFTLREMPLISSVEIKGYDDVSKDDVEGVVTTEAGKILNSNTLKTDAEDIITLYKNKGYLDSEVKYETEEEGDKVKVIFDIKENKRFYVKEIIFEGNKAYSDKELKDMMDTSEWGIFHFLTDSGLLKEDKLKQDVDKLNAFYLNNGYINARVGEPEVTHDEKEWIYVKIVVSEGEQFGVGNVDIAGDALSVPRPELMEKLSIKKNKYFNRKAIMEDIDYLSGVCNDEGYAYANIIPQTIPNEQDKKVDVVYGVEKGNLVYVDRISVTGNTKTRDKVIRRELAVVEGDLSSREKIRKSYMNLNKLRYFEEVDFQTAKGSEVDLMNIDIHVKERPTGLFSIGAGYSAQDKAVFMAQISQQNLFGKGQVLSLNTRLGSETTNYELSFIEPWLFDMPLWSQFNIWDSEREYDSYDLETQGLGVTLGYPLWKDIKGYAGYRFSTNDVRNVQDDASYYIKEQEGETTSSGVTLTISRDTTDDRMFPTMGSKNSFSVEYTGTIFQGDTSFTKYILSSSWFLSLPFKNVFAIKGRGGMMHKNEDKKIPIYDRFYLGGINSIRGLRDVGPIDPETGDPIGGETMLCFNAEIIFPLIEDAGMKGVVFFDTGNAWEEGYHIDDMRKTAGAGIRWYSPIGPLRLEWGYVLDRKDDEAASRWEFTIGVLM